MQVSQVDFSAIAFSPFVATKGVKTSQATLNGAPVEFLLSNDEWFPAPFGASAFNDEKATRPRKERRLQTGPRLALAEPPQKTGRERRGLEEAESSTRPRTERTPAPAAGLAAPAAAPDVRPGRPPDSEPASRICPTDCLKFEDQLSESKKKRQGRSLEHVF